MTQQDANSMKQEVYQQQPYVLREDEKIPLFLIKLWNIVEDPAYYDVIRWDESGYSFHIMDPYSFCRNVLPQFFKHNNLNSLIRQLNMYGFRKMTPIERTSLARAESDQDHLEFSHPYFVRDHPDLLSSIKRKVPNSRQTSANNGVDIPFGGQSVNVPSKDLTAIFEELRQLRERQKNMEFRMSELVKENELVWQEMDHMRSAHAKQQQIVNKLVQFIASLVQPNKQHRLGKRQLLAIDEFHAKRARDTISETGSNASSGNATRFMEDLVMSDKFCDLSTTNTNIGGQYGAAPNQISANEVLDTLISEMASGGLMNLPSLGIPSDGHYNIPTSRGPIIAEVTDDLDQLNAASGNGTTDSNIQQSQQRQRRPSSNVGMNVHPSTVVELQQRPQPKVAVRKRSAYNENPRRISTIEPAGQTQSAGGYTVQAHQRQPIVTQQQQQPQQQQQQRQLLQQQQQQQQPSSRLLSYQQPSPQQQPQQVIVVQRQAPQCQQTVAAAGRRAPSNSNLLRYNENVVTYDNTKTNPQQKSQLYSHHQTQYVPQQSQQSQIGQQYSLTERLQSQPVRYTPTPSDRPPPLLQQHEQQQFPLPSNQQQQQQQPPASIGHSSVARPMNRSPASVRSPIVESPQSQVSNPPRQVFVCEDTDPTSMVTDPNMAGTIVSGEMASEAAIEQAILSTPQQQFHSSSDDSDLAPKITFEDSPSDFNTYFNSVNREIENCRDGIADHWTLNNLLDDIDLDSNEWQELLNDENMNELMQSSGNGDFQQHNPAAPYAQISALPQQSLPQTPASNQLMDIPLSTPVKQPSRN